MCRRDRGCAAVGVVSGQRHVPVPILVKPAVFEGPTTPKKVTVCPLVSMVTALELLTITPE